MSHSNPIRASGTAVEERDMAEGETLTHASGAPVGAAPRRAPFKVTNPERIPKERYYDEEFFRLEAEHLWPRVWQMACRLEEIPEVGDWVEYRNLDQSVIVVRTRGGVKAFQNACRHRGVQLVGGHGNCGAQGFICPFHGWRWNMDGKNTFVLGRQLFSEENLQAAELKLVPVRVELWGGCAFINFDADAAPLLDCIAPSAKRLDPRNVDKLKVEWWRSAILPTNWKLAMEAFMEGYHVMRTHPQLHALSLPGTDRYAPPMTEGASPVRGPMSVKDLVELSIANMSVLSEGMAGMVHASDIAVAHDIKDKVVLPEDPAAAIAAWFGQWNAAVTERARARGVPMPDLNDLAANHPCAPVQFIFPHYFLLPTFGNMSSYRIRPLSPETCLFEIWSLVLYPEDEARPRPIAPEPMAHDDERFPPIPQQDYSNLPRQQLGLHARGFEYMRLSRSVEGMISNYQRLVDGFLEGVPKDKLTKAMQVASGELDDPIRDIGF
jgi:phenylpropionate dioxygenase-like ring-hydroxylating dioxygenase large terminal subunit